MEILHDPGDFRALALLALLAAPTVLALLAGGIAAAALVAIGTLVVLFVWRVFLMPSLFFMSDIVDNVRRVPPDQFASRRRKWW